MRRWAAVGVAAFALGCSSVGDAHLDRVEVLARSCVSIAERRVGDDFDRPALERVAGAAAMAEVYEEAPGRQPSGASVLTRLCRPRPSGS